MEKTKSKFSLDLNKQVKVFTRVSSYFGREFVGTIQDFYELLDVKDNFMPDGNVEERLKRLYENCVIKWGGHEDQKKYIYGVLEDDVEKINKVRKELHDTERTALLNFIDVKFNEGILEETIIEMIIDHIDFDAISDYVNTKQLDLIRMLPQTKEEELFDYLEHLYDRIHTEVKDINVFNLCQYIMDYVDVYDVEDVERVIRRFEMILSKDSGNFMFDTSMLRNIPSGEQWIHAINQYYQTDGKVWVNSVRDIHEYIVDEFGYNKDYHAFRKALSRIYNVGGRKALDISKHYENSTYNI